MPLTDTAVRNAKAREKAYKLSDGGGLYVLVSTSGARLWNLAYRFNGKQKKLSFGEYPAVSLSDARAARDEAKKVLATGTDPSRKKKEDKLRAKIEEATTFRVVAEEWFAHVKAKWVSTYSTRIWSRIEDDVLPAIGHLPIAEIEAPELLDMVRAVEGRGAIEMAKRELQSCSQIFRYAIATGRARRDPCGDLRGALKPRGKKNHRASLKAPELPAFLQALANYDGEAQTRIALQLVTLTFVRTQELRFATWSEFENLDSDEPIWRIPAERMKMGLEHLVPLAPQVVTLLRELRPLCGESKLLFPSPGKKGVMSENTMIYAMYRMGYKSRATVHGLRSTASTILNESGWNADWIERQLAHAEQDEVRAAYNAAEWLQDRTRMMNWWADYIDARAAGKHVSRLRAA